VNRAIRELVTRSRVATATTGGSPRSLARLAVATGRPTDMIAQTLLNDGRAVLGVTDMLVHLRGTGVQWNPADHLCVARQVLCQQAVPPGNSIASLSCRFS
jgi:hypothetical protein